MKKVITVTEITSDLSGAEATTRREFGLNGTNYALDLTAEEGSEFDELFAPYIAVAQVEKGRAKAGQGKRQRGPRNKETAAIREWATGKGIDLNPQGRIPNEVREQYLAEQAKSTDTPAQATTEATPEPALAGASA